MESEKERMTDIRQLERDTQNIDSLNEHASYCECIWCLDGSTQSGENSDLAKEEMEQALTAMLKDLFLPITNTKQENVSGYIYIWQILQHCCQCLFQLLFSKV